MITPPSRLINFSSHIFYFFLVPSKDFFCCFSNFKRPAQSEKKLSIDIFTAAKLLIIIKLLPPAVKKINFKPNNYSIFTQRRFAFFGNFKECQRKIIAKVFFFLFGTFTEKKPSRERSSQRQSKNYYSWAHFSMCQDFYVFFSSNLIWSWANWETSFYLSYRWRKKVSKLILTNYFSRNIVSTFDQEST